jgi:hypothetical protein
VTTPDKGEITHFYSGSQDSYNGTNTKLGHEYWLREFKGGSVSQNTFVANMTKPEAGSGGDKEYSNTFLWDYYYNYDNYLDKNTDEYQKTYYKDGHTYSNYAYSVAGKPYIIGLPGKRYYEFDLSGQFVPQNTHLDNIKKLAAQTVIFASNPGVVIRVSDEELQQQTVTANGYRFVPSYINTTLTTAGMGYVLADDGGSFDKNAAGDVSSAFRPYFTATSGARATTRSIVFGSEESELKGAEEYGDPRDGLNGTLLIYAKKGKIIVESSLNHTVDVGIFTPAGLMMYTLTVKAGETVEQKVNTSGIYIVQPSDRQYTKKLMVKK